MNDSILFWSSLDVLTFARYQAIRARFGDLEKARRHVTPEFFKELGCRPETIKNLSSRIASFDPKFLQDRLSRLGARIFFINDSDFPSMLREIPDPPVFLFVRGTLPPLHKVLAVVGTRLISDYGKFATEKFVFGLVHAGFVIVSGLAIGVDACAHARTLTSGGATIAVLGSGVDLLMPYQNKALGESILKKGGAIVSEYALGTHPEAFSFPRRNRIISGLSRGTLVVEGGVKSGALITARCALEQGRDVFAIPGNIQQLGMAGTNHLIRRGEAKLVEKVEDILEEYQINLSVQQSGLPLTFQEIPVFTETEKQLLDELSRGGRTMDELSRRLSLTVSRLSELLVGLQLKGNVREVGHQWVAA